MVQWGHTLHFTMFDTNLSTKRYHTLPEVEFLCVYLLRSSIFERPYDLPNFILLPPMSALWCTPYLGSFFHKILANPYSEYLQQTKTKAQQVALLIWNHPCISLGINENATHDRIFGKKNSMIITSKYEWPAEAHVKVL